ncbi:glycoside hydrolase family 125 protein [Bacillus sp. V2I10]|uniref:glycoside hydrolase family 125 protein n=1 Tax=Bacillus sp. V2I10 TaxID=3042276 RepID=UPI0027836ED8|nr:meiotically up-regulated gene 157 (Mug157) protein [Bacillus sp. V2I10]
MNATIPESMKKLILKVNEHFPNDQKLQEMFAQCFINTYTTTLKPQKDGTTFVITGDIPAMWLRDSAAQVRPYLILAEEDAQIAEMIEGVVSKQFQFINHDPYANAFNETPSGKGHQGDLTDMTPYIWERKYEVDSLCYPLQLAYLLWKSTGRTSHLNDSYKAGLKSILNVWKVEQNHENKSAYRFERENVRQSDTLTRSGMGSEVIKTGMTWSAFRPSDDACHYGYLVPANMFAVVVLKYSAEICLQVLLDSELAKECMQLACEIEEGIKKYSVINHPIYEEMYVYETDGRGGYNLMDDANVPSLLSIPYLGYCDFNDQTYQNTRHFLLSRDNPYYYEGKLASGIGSPHTPDHYIWHIALAIQGMTAQEESEKQRILSVFKETDGDTGYMHEGFNSDDPKEYTREWFSWANSMFSEFVLSLCGYTVKGSPLNQWLQNK